MTKHKYFVVRVVRTDVSDFYAFRRDFEQSPVFDQVRSRENKYHLQLKFTVKNESRFALYLWFTTSSGICLLVHTA